MTPEEKNELLGTLRSPGWKHVRNWLEGRIEKSKNDALTALVDGSFREAQALAAYADAFEYVLIHFDDILNKGK